MLELKKMMKNSANSNKSFFVRGFLIIIVTKYKFILISIHILFFGILFFIFYEPI